MSVNKILLLMCHWIGDTFWAMQVIPEVRKLYPDAELWIGIKPFSKDLFKGIIREERIILLSNVISDRHREKFNFTGYVKELRKVRERKFDLIIDLTGNRYSALFLFLSGIPVKVGLKGHVLSFLYNVKGGKFDYSGHLINRPFEVVRTLYKSGHPTSNIQHPTSKAEYRIPNIQFPDIGFHFDVERSMMNVGCSHIIRVYPGTDVTVEELGRKLGFDVSERKVALLCPGAGWAEKQWAMENFIGCGRRLEAEGYKVIISGSVSERELCEKVAGSLSDAMIFIERLKYFIALVPYVKLSVTNDSAPAHLLAAKGIKLAVIFLVTEKNKCGPVGNNVKVFEREDATLESVVKYLLNP